MIKEALCWLYTSEIGNFFEGLFSKDFLCCLRLMVKNFHFTVTEVIFIISFPIQRNGIFVWVHAPVCQLNAARVVVDEPQHNRCQWINQKSKRSSSAFQKSRLTKNWVLFFFSVVKVLWKWALPWVPVTALMVFDTIVEAPQKGLFVGNSDRHLKISR